jgi:hypothetical protein
MITDIPSKEDFDAVGSALLDQSWGMATALLLDLDEAKQWTDVDDVEEYWKSASIKMATALSIAHQGAEFLIKGRIVAVSPYLLIANAPREWPKADANGLISFSKFRTIDAQDLIRLHDSAAPLALPSDFAIAFESLRVRRNSIMHTVDRDLKIHVGELVENILEINHSLMPGRDWVTARTEALEESPVAMIDGGGEWLDAQVKREFLAVKEILPRQAMKRYFGFDPKRRAYLCPTCSWDYKWDELEARTALLEPNTPESEEIVCYLCKDNHSVVRTDCAEDECPGNVISLEYDRCLTCGTHQPDGGEDEATAEQ